MKSSNFLLVLSSIVLAVLPAYFVSRHPISSGKDLRAIDERLDVYGKR